MKLVIQFESLECADAFTFALDLFCPELANCAELFEEKGVFFVALEGVTRTDLPAFVQVNAMRIPFARS